MATNAYLARMNELEQRRSTKNDEEARTAAGLPIQKPMAQEHTGMPYKEVEKPQEDDSYKQSMFFMNHNDLMNSNERYKGAFDELSKLATGLREQVKQGYMPEAIAQDRIHQFVNDTANNFAKNETKFNEEDAAKAQQEQIGALLQKFSGQPQQAPQQMPAEGVSPEQAAQMGGGAPQGAPMQGGQQ